MVLSRVCSGGGEGGRGGGLRLLVNLVPMLKQQQNMRKGTFSKQGSAKRCHRLGSEKCHFSGKRVGK